MDSSDLPNSDVIFNVRDASLDPESLAYSLLCSQGRNRQPAFQSSQASGSASQPRSQPANDNFANNFLDENSCSRLVRSASRDIHNKLDELIMLNLSVKRSIQAIRERLDHLETLSSKRLFPDSSHNSGETNGYDSVPQSRRKENCGHSSPRSKRTRFDDNPSDGSDVNVNDLIPDIQRQVDGFDGSITGEDLVFQSSAQNNTATNKNDPHCRPSKEHGTISSENSPQVITISSATSSENSNENSNDNSNDTSSDISSNTSSNERLAK